MIGVSIALSGGDLLGQQAQPRTASRPGRFVSSEDLYLHRAREPQRLPSSIARMSLQQPAEEAVMAEAATTEMAEATAQDMASQAMDASLSAEGGLNQMSLSAGSQKPPDFTILAGEPYSIQVPESIGTYQGYVQGRRDFLTVVPTAGAAQLGLQMLDLIGSKPGATDLTLIGDAGKSESIRVLVKPSVASLQAELAKNFPDCNVELSMPGDNLIMVNGTVESAAQVEPIISLLRSLVGSSGQVISGLRTTGVMQVQLDVVVAFINRTKARNLGFNFSSSGPSSFFGGQQVGNIAGPPVLNVPAAATPFTPLTPGAIPGASTVFFGVTNRDSGFYGYLEALQSNNCFKVMANPSLVTLSGRPATFIVGGEQPYPIVNGFSATGVTFKKFGTSLVFTPLVLGEGKIRLELRPEVSRLDRSNPFQVNGEAVPSIINQEVHAVVEMESGQTLILGGLLETQTLGRVNKVPVLGDLPVAGALFRRVEQQEEERELLVMATPRLVAPIEPSQGPIALPGDESRSPCDHELYCQGVPEARQGACPPRTARTQLDSMNSGGNPYPLKTPPTAAEDPGLIAPGIVTPMSYEVPASPSKGRGLLKRPAGSSSKDLFKFKGRG